MYENLTEVELIPMSVLLPEDLHNQILILFLF